MKKIPKTINFLLDSAAKKPTTRKNTIIEAFGSELAISVAVLGCTWCCICQRLTLRETVVFPQRGAV
jgi:hypothetical protein